MTFRRGLSRRAGAVALGLVADAVLGEPPQSLHPVAGFGRAMDGLERLVWADRRARGILYTAVGVGGAAAGGYALSSMVGPYCALASSTLVSAAGRSLMDTATEIGRRLQAGDLKGARERLPALVGRDPADLDEKEIARAVVESVAENLSDAVAATAVWGILVGAPGALVHRAANTLDAMVGHHTPRYERFGWAAALLDDAMGWPAARLSALTVALAAPRRAWAALQAVRSDERRHPSPNAGVIEAAFAGALDLRLGGTNRYGERVEVRPALGTGRPPEVQDIDRAVALARRAQWLLVVVLVGTARVAGRGRP